jgi:uncharacterized membrane protein YphA (DoxX/SURF4 family)
MQQADAPERTGRQVGLKVLTLVLGLQFVVSGVWAFFGPVSFYDNVATFEPYNLHLLHDVGAFQLGIGAAVLAALRWRDGLLAALAGGTVGAAFHAWSHLMDRDLGGRSSDPWTLGLLALLFLAAFAWQLRARGRT